MCPYLPSSQPRLISAGEYLAEIAGRPVEKTSNFDPDRTYYQLPLLLRSKRGDWLKFTWNFSPTSAIYEDALLAIGGQRNMAGGVDEPSMPEGRRFTVMMIKETSKDGKERNKIVSCSPCDAADTTAGKPFSSAGDDEEPPPAAGEPPADDNDDVPFL